MIFLALLAGVVMPQSLPSTYSSCVSPQDLLSLGFDVYETIIDSAEQFLVWADGNASTTNMFLVS
jgi:hypothetical protein